MTRYLLIAAACTGVAAGAAALGARHLRRKIAVVTVRGLSMRPALNAGDRLLIRRVRTADRLRAGQIVVIERPDSGGDPAGGPPSWPPAGHDWLVKRVAALPGEPTPPVMLAATAPGAAPVVPAGKLAVLGDNLSVSHDSRVFGYVAADRVLGVMIRPLPG